jgi:hypothetical protein
MRDPADSSILYRRWIIHSGDNGRARIDGIAPGSYRLRAWHPGLSLDAEWPSTTVRVDAADFEQSIVLGVTSNPLGVTP